ncbi:MAG: hypothetical protein LBK13_11465 [Spirochaetales bacterium]|jgi:hypothetical protein|nr:hypothetical protein [Spirochaetales bacterium]
MSHAAAYDEETHTRPMTEQEKLDILCARFMRLDEPRKDYIRDLTRKLMDIPRPFGFAASGGSAPSVRPVAVPGAGDMDAEV